jgi:hypothetical protein
MYTVYFTRNCHSMKIAVILGFGPWIINIWLKYLLVQAVDSGDINPVIIVRMFHEPFLYNLHEVCSKFNFPV